MAILTSEITTTNINVDNTKYDQNYFSDQYSLLIEEGFTEYLACTKTKHSPVFYFYNNDNIIGTSLKYYGEYTEVELDLLNQIIQPGFVTYDIGANIGYHSVGLAKKSKTVYSFEPNNKNYKLLQLNTQYFKNIQTYNVAVSDSKGTTHISDFNLDDSGNYGECMISEVGQQCDTITIDELVQNRKILPPNVVKIDVEGYEYTVIKGMLQTIKDNLPIIFYEHLHGLDLPKIHKTLVELGYKIYWYPAPNYNPNNFNKNTTNIFGNGGVLNALALPWYLNVQTNLPEKLTPNETWTDCVTRLQNAQSN